MKKLNSNSKNVCIGNREKHDIAHSLGAQFVPMDTLLRESDFVLPLVPLNNVCMLLLLLLTCFKNRKIDDTILEFIIIVIIENQRTDK
jgi:lactate dehydrogenase-like 2-hydroxyacid dehydrogenase